MFLEYLVTNSYNIFVRRYRSWKNIQAIQEAERIEIDLAFQLKRQPSKRDFKEAGLYRVWMALYRYRRKMRQRSGIFNGWFLIEYLFDIRKEILNPAMKNQVVGILEDCVIALGPNETEDILDKIWRRRFHKVRSTYKTKVFKKLRPLR
jgi:hypothetical protein